MFEMNGFVYGGYPADTIKITDVKPLDDMILILPFSSGERRLFDATILEGSVFEKLKDNEVFKNCSIEFGVVTWMDGEIDCAPEYMYKHSYEYSHVDYNPVA